MKNVNLRKSDMMMCCRMLISRANDMAGASDRVSMRRCMM